MLNLSICRARTFNNYRSLIFKSSYNIVTPSCHFQFFNNINNNNNNNNNNINNSICVRYFSQRPDKKLNEEKVASNRIGLLTSLGLGIYAIMLLSLSSSNITMEILLEISLALSYIY